MASRASPSVCGSCWRRCVGSWRNLERLAVISRRTFLSASEGGLLATPPATEVQQLRRGTDQTPHECAAEDHWITSSARARSDGGIVRSSAFAVSRLITSSNFVGCSMGRARGNAPDNSEDQKEMKLLKNDFSCGVLHVSHYRGTRRALTMMGHQPREESLFYSFRLEDQIPETHLLRLIDRYVDFSFVRDRLQPLYSSTGRPSIDPEVLLRLLLVGYLYGISSERRLLDEARMHLAYRWFTRLGLDQEVPDHSTFSKNRHGRFRQAGVFREVFEEIVRRCLAAGLVEGRHLTVDGTMVYANASPQRRVAREQLAEVAQVSRTVPEYLADLERQNPVAEPPPASGIMSATDPDATWAVKWGRAGFAYYDNYLIDNASRVIVDVAATPARFRHESLAARRMLERIGRLGLRPQSLGADKAYGSGEFVAWLLGQGIEPH